MERRHVKTTVIKPSDWHRDGDKYRIRRYDEEYFAVIVQNGSKPNSARIYGHSLTEAGFFEPYYDAVHCGLIPAYNDSDIEEVDDLLDEQGRPCRDIVLCDDFLDEMDRLAELDEIAFVSAMTMAKEWKGAGGIGEGSLVGEWADPDDFEIRPVSNVYFLCE